MESVFDFAKNICTFTLVITLIMNIFPNYYNKKYIKLFAGILLICLILNPIINWKKSKFEIEDIISGYTHGKYDETIENDISELESKIIERLENESS